MATAKDKVQITKTALENYRKTQAKAVELEKEKRRAEKEAQSAKKDAEVLASEFKSMEQQNQEMAAKIEELEKAAAAVANPSPALPGKLCAGRLIFLHENPLTHLPEFWYFVSAVAAAADAALPPLVPAAPAQAASQVPAPVSTNLRTLPKSKSKKKKGKYDHLCEELVSHVIQTAKTVGFCNFKFIQDIEEERDAARFLIPFLPVTLKMSEEEFIENYKGVVYDAIKAARTEVQSNGKKRVQGASKFC